RAQIVGLPPDIEPGMAADQIHAGIAKSRKPLALVDLDHRHARAKVPAQHRISPVVGVRYPARAVFFKLGLHPPRPRPNARLAADRIGPADEMPWRRHIIK